MEVYQAGETVYWQFNTRDADGAPITFAGSPTVAVRKDDGTTTDTDGVTLTVDSGSVTGLHVLSIDTSQDETFYATDHEFTVIVTAGTVDGTSVVGEVVLRFRLGEVPADVQAWDGGTLPVPAEAGDEMDLVDAPNSTAVAAIQSGLATPGDIPDISDLALEATVAALNNLSAAEVNAEVDQALLDYGAAKPADLAALALEATVEAVGGKVDALQDLSAAEVEAAIEAYGAAKPADLANLDAAISSRLAAEDYVEPPTVEEIDAELISSHGDGPWGQGVPDGYSLVPYTLKDGDGVGVAGVWLKCTLDEAGSQILDWRLTNAQGVATFILAVESGTTVYIWHKYSTSGDMEVVP